jgi:tRNA A-37 threonylcarbamoyl transferase component Bud32
LTAEILRFGRHIAGTNRITAAFMFGSDESELSDVKMPIKILLVIYGFQSKLMNYVKTFDGRSVVFIATDEWVFERDVDRGFLGEALAWGLIFPYLPLVNKEYLHSQEVKLKERLILELMENLVLDFPELSYELRMKPEYFMYAAMLSRARIFPPMIYHLRGLMQKCEQESNMNQVFGGYLEALKKLQDKGMCKFLNGYVQMSEKFVDGARNPKVRLVNLSKTIPRALFSSVLDVWPRLLNVLSQDWEMAFKLQRDEESLERIGKIEIPERYLYVPTASGLVPLGNKLNIETYARELLRVDKDTKIAIEEMGGILNDVFLIKASVRDEEKKVVVKRFRDWSSFKWFPLTLWSVGTRTFAVLGLQRLERECAINQYLNSRGIAVPKLLHVSTDDRLVFMEYVEGEDASKVVKRVAKLKTAVQAKKNLKIIERIGKKFARVHALGIALGDTKPENIIIGKHSEIILTDFEQASRNGDKVWDIAEFLYYAGHDMPPLTETRVAELVAEAFIAGYLEAGGKTEAVRKAGNPKYTKVFSVFTLPHIMLAISNICRRTGKTEE